MLSFAPTKLFKTQVNNFGIHTGEAVIGNVGTAEVMDYTAIGDTVNLGSRLQGLSHGGQITISKEAYDQVAEHIEIGRLSTGLGTPHLETNPDFIGAMLAFQN